MDEALIPHSHIIEIVNRIQQRNPSSFVERICQAICDELCESVYNEEHTERLNKILEEIKP